MKTLYYLSFNNYYNRLMKRHENVTEYLSAGAIPCGTSPDVNFFVNDGIYAQHTPYINLLNDIPDYLLVMNEGEIESRWFVTECRYNTGKTQYICSLYRDLIAEFWPQIVDKPFFCEKGWLSTFDSGIFNDEAITTNQIKRSEYFLEDKTGCPWIVGYYQPRKPDSTDENIPFTHTAPTPNTTVNGIQSWEYYNKTASWVDDWNLSLYYMEKKVFSDNVMWHIPFRPGVKGTPWKGSTVRDNWQSWMTSSTFAERAAYYSGLGNYPNAFRARFTEYTGHSFDNSTRATWNGLDGLIIKDSLTDSYYEVNIKKTQHNVEIQPIDPSSSLGVTMTEMLAIVDSNFNKVFDMEGTPNEYNYEYSCTYTRYEVELIPATFYSGNIKISGNRKTLIDAPYSMFCMPYGYQEYLRPGDDILVPRYEISTSGEISLQIASAIAAAKSGGNVLYDLQLLPYCPIEFLRNKPDIVGPGISLNIGRMIEGVDYDLAFNSDNTPIGIIFWAEQSSGKFTIDLPVGLGRFNSNNMGEMSALEFKVGNQTEFLRLCSPNYNGVFEFSPYKNRGVDYFQVSFTYKPYQPFIQLAPNFKELYGRNYNDGRGLILGGDFSLPIMEDKWQTYQINNKNYQGMFNRQIENMEVQHKYQRRQDILNAITGTAQGGVTGGMAGGMAGGPWGAVAGAAVGTIASGAGGILDVQASDALRAEAIDYSKDLFGMQLDNIKALPMALTRVSAYNIQNKLFPFIEAYDCTAQEKQAVRNKIIYNGMTIGRIGTISEFSNGDEEWTYVKGQLIRLTGIAEDSHVVNTIANELYKGVFV